MTDFRSERIRCRNIHAGVIFEAGTPMNEDHKSKIAILHEMKFGSVQMNWQGSDAEDATVQLYVSNLLEPDSFVAYDETFDCIGALGGKLWNIGIIGFLYCYIDYKKGSVTTGTMSAVATGKK